MAFWVGGFSEFVFFPFEFEFSPEWLDGQVVLTLEGIGNEVQTRGQTLYQVESIKVSMRVPSYLHILVVRWDIPLCHWSVGVQWYTQMWNVLSVIFHIKDKLRILVVFLSAWLGREEHSFKRGTSLEQVGGWWQRVTASLQSMVELYKDGSNEIYTGLFGGNWS